MPSTHSSAIAFFGTYLSLSSILLPLHPRVKSLIPFSSTWLRPIGPGAVEPSFWRSFTSHYGERVTRISMAAMFLFGAASVCWSRVRLGHHTPAQVLVGATLGSLVAATWMTIWLGTSSTFELAGLDSSIVPGFLPAWLSSGLQVQGRVWERAFEDALFLGIEAWRDRDWSKLGTLRTFPVVEL